VPPASLSTACGNVGSSRPMARTASITAWCLRPEVFADECRVASDQWGEIGFRCQVSDFEKGWNDGIVEQ